MQLDRKQQLIILLLVGVMLFAGGYRYAQIKERAAAEGIPVLETAVEKAPTELQVHVAGAVARPGVYKLPEGARVIDAVNLAGPLEDAALDALKLAAPVTDGQTIPVPWKMASAESDAVSGNVAGTSGSMSSGRGGSGAPVFGPGVALVGATAVNGLVNINTADISRLDTLPGIGPALAERIVQYRETNGLFYSVEDIKNVSGIGDKKFEDLKDKITVH